MSEKTETELETELQGSESGKAEAGEGSNTSSRARNRTVMLTPEITGQVRSMLGGDTDTGDRPDPLADLLPPLSGDFSARQHSPRPSEALGAVSVGGEDERDPTGKFKTAVASRESNPEPVGVPSFSVNSNAVAPTPVAGGSRVVSSSPKSRIVGFLISFDADENGDVYEVRAGRWLLTSRPTDHGDYILIDDSTISPLHAIIRATKKGVVQVLDQLSEFGTGVTKCGETTEEEVTGAMAVLEHGDSVRFGERSFIFCMVPEVSAADSESSE